MSANGPDSTSDLDFDLTDGAASEMWYTITF